MIVKNTEDVSTLYLKILAYGAAGSGKTRMCATTNGKTLIISAEAGLLSLAGQDVDYVEVKTMEDLRDVYNTLLTDTKYSWICLDSISEIAEVVLVEEKKKTLDGRKAYSGLNDFMMVIIRNFRDLPKNIYFTAKMAKEKDETTGGLIYTPSMPGNKLSQALPFLFDLIVCFHNWKDEQGIEQSALQTRKDAQHEAKDRSGKLDMAEKPNLTTIYNKIFNQQPKGE